MRASVKSALFAPRPMAVTFCTSTGSIIAWSVDIAAQLLGVDLLTGHTMQIDCGIEFSSNVPRERRAIACYWEPSQLTVHLRQTEHLVVARAKHCAICLCIRTVVLTLS